MASAVPTVEAIKEGFPHLVVPRQPGEPTYKTIRTVHRLLKANAASIPSDLGGGAHGLLGLLLTDAVYQTITGVLFTRPVNPGTTATIPARSTGKITRRLERDHKESLRVYREVERTDQALKQQLLASFDDMHLKAQRNAHVGYSNSTTMDLVTHLYNSYGNITQIDLSENESRMKAPYDITTPIENLFAQIDEAVEFAEAGNSAFTAMQIVNTAYLLIFQTGALEKACDEWIEKPIVDQTWDIFKNHFTAAHQLFKTKQKLRHNGFNTFQQNHHANNIHQSDTQQETAYALQALADATQYDREAVANLSQANHTLTQQLKDMTAILQQVQNTVTQLEQKIDKLLARPSKPPVTYDRNSTHYCWSHGRTFNSNHTSKSCRFRKPHHQEGATLQNKMGGSDSRCGPSE